MYHKYFLQEYKHRLLQQETQQCNAHYFKLPLCHGLKNNQHKVHVWIQVYRKIPRRRRMMTTAVKQNMQVLLNGIVNVMHSLTIFMLFFTCSPPSTDPVYHKSKKFIVFEECLLSLFKKCQNCGNAEWFW